MMRYTNPHSLRFTSEDLDNQRYTFLTTGAIIRQTLVKIASFSSGRGNSARSSPDRCTKTSRRVTTSTAVVVVALGAQILVSAQAALMTAYTSPYPWPCSVGWHLA